MRRLASAWKRGKPRPDLPQMGISEQRAMAAFVSALQATHNGLHILTIPLRRWLDWKMLREVIKLRPLSLKINANHIVIAKQNDHVVRMAIDDVGHPPKAHCRPDLPPLRTGKNAKDARLGRLRQVSYPVVAARCIGRASSQTGDDGP